ncbi:MAG: aquaporin [Candidatus Eremiobacteraeota bacterium]|nr:aquaporin [Candidatus Eremiobacteraeota bacterium]MBV8459327.1 aquaporin [Candidatus Eremiobacteraeota bacterium]
MRRLLAEFIGVFGLVFSASGGAAILAGHGGAHLALYQSAMILSGVSALWLVAAVCCFGDISSHFNPATTFAFALRRDMHWPVACAYFVIQFAAATAGAATARTLFGLSGRLGAAIPPQGHEWRAVAFEAILTFGFVLLVLSMANGPRLNGTLTPLAIGAYVMAAGTMGGSYDGAAFNPARAFGPAFVIGNLTSYWVYPLGSLIGAYFAVLAAILLRGRASSREAQTAIGTALGVGAPIGQVVQSQR